MGKDMVGTLKEILIIVVIAYLLSLLIKAFIIETTIIPTGSMLPTIQLQDRVIVNKLVYRFKSPQRGDIIIFDPPESVITDEEFMKRVIGLPGETVEMKDGKVYINGRALIEPYVQDPLNYEYGPVVVPDDSLLVLGDNRNNSYDSHEWNEWLTIDRLDGKAFFTYWPSDHIKVLEREVAFQ